MNKLAKILIPSIIVILLAGCVQYGNQVKVDDSVKPEAVSETVEESVSEVPDDLSDPSKEALIPLKETITSSDGLGEGAICGTCINSKNINDEKFMYLVKEHYNAVTLENELKPEAMLGKNNAAPPAGSIHEEELNGEVIQVPTLDHTRADKMLDKILEINASIDDPIRVRGHVLVWHSQTPEWFFHVDYDKNNDYVTPDEMNRRLEWYIKSVLEYYTGKDSKYRELFYGWDVVNEAVSDRTGTYRTDTEESSWWKVYGSNEFIINAFMYANKYAPEDIDLYYNDYNECSDRKLKGILSLIEEVKAADGTRIDGFGMQGHYKVNDPVADKIEEAAKAYAGCGIKVMLSELDVKASMFYDGTEEGLPKEFERQGKYFGAIYDTFKKLHKEGIDIAGITFWGASDKYTWLDGQRPLLFDTDYQPKPAFEAFK